MWKDIIGFKGYQISDTGEVRTYNKVTCCKLHGIRHWEDRLLAPKIGISKRNRGDKRVDLWKDGKPYTIKVSRLVACTFLNKDLFNSTLTVNHINGDFNDNRIENLELIPLKENIQHAFATGLMENICKRTIVVDKKHNTEITCRSEAEASRYMGKQNKYVWYMLSKGKTENGRYAWRVVE